MTRWSDRALSAALLGALLTGSATCEEAPPSPSLETPKAPATSNLLPTDYVGPDACQVCHEAIHASWSKHPHSVMNQWARPDTVKADFSGVSIPFLGGTVRFERAGERYLMKLERGLTKRTYRVLRTVGSRHTQFFIGRQIEGPEPRDHALYTTEQRLPFAYWFRLQRWLPESYFDPWGPDRDGHGRVKRDPFGRPDVLVYAENCMVCHTTYPYLYRLGNFPVRRGFPPQHVRFDDRAMWATWKQTVDLGAIYQDKVSRHLDPNEHLVRMGITCESCHFGARQHVEQQAVPSKFPRSDAPHVRVHPPEDRQRAPSWQNPYLVNSICRQCHSAKGRTFANGAGVGNSREALDLDASSCHDQIRCNDCHDPHTSIGLAPPDPDPVHLRACVRCHSKYADPQAASGHAAHPPEAGVSCMSCHMPRIAQGIDRIVRTHRIGSPTDPSMLAVGSLNACNLCHLEKSIAWTTDALRHRWGVEVTLNPAWRLAYQGFDTPLGPKWLFSADPAERQAATAAYGRSPLGRASLPLLLPRLDDPAPVNRMFALFAVQDLLGRALPRGEYDPTASPTQRRQQISALGARLSKRP